MSKTILIIGGGIAGISCLESLVQCYKQDCLYGKIILIAESRLIKKVKNLRVRGRNLETFDVQEIDYDEADDLFIPDSLQVEFVVGSVIRLDALRKVVTTRSHSSHHVSPQLQEYKYDYLSICIGASPKTLCIPVIDEYTIQERVVTIRDVASVDNLRARLASCRRAAILGNGGISLGLVDKISGCQVVWVTRDDSIGGPLLDSGASVFLLDKLNSPGTKPRPHSRPLEFTLKCNQANNANGPALGPNWLNQTDLKGDSSFRDDLNIIYNSGVETIEASRNSNWPLSVNLTSGQRVYCDLIIIAIGVEPNRLEIEHATIGISTKDGGILVDEQMRTSIEGVYAAGDVASCDNWSSNPLWFQMRLWTQARQMGHYCGRCIASHLEGSDPAIYSSFDCFTHVTEFFGEKVVLLGRYCARDMSDSSSPEIEVVARVRPKRDYVKLLLRTGVVIGAILVGDTDLEETMENLICDAMDVSQIKDQLLDDTVDIEDYFD